MNLAFLIFPRSCFSRIRIFKICRFLEAHLHKFHSLTDMFDVVRNLGCCKFLFLFFISFYSSVNRFRLFTKFLIWIFVERNCLLDSLFIISLWDMLTKISVGFSFEKSSLHWDFSFTLFLVQKIKIKNCVISWLNCFEVAIFVNWKSVNIIFALISFPSFDGLWLDSFTMLALLFYVIVLHFIFFCFLWSLVDHEVDYESWSKFSYRQCHYSIFPFPNWWCPFTFLVYSVYV